MAKNKLITIIGTGPNLGLALARLFGKKGFTVAMISRNAQKLESFQQQLEAEGIEAYYYIADVADEPTLRMVLGYIRESLGDTDVLVYNAVSIRKSNLLQETPEQLIQDFRINVIGAVVASQEVLPAMEARKQGKIFITGDDLSLHANCLYGSLGIGKAGLRNAAYALHQQLKAKNIHVATVTISGSISPEDEKYSPAAIAGQFWQLYLQEQEGFEREIIY